jgi:hypothetical protein
LFRYEIKGDQVSWDNALKKTKGTLLSVHSKNKQRIGKESMEEIARQGEKMMEKAPKSKKGKHGKSK